MNLLVRALLLILAGVVFFFLMGVYLTWAPDKPVDALKERWAQPPSQFVGVQGMQVHLRDEGPRDDPNPIVLLHGTSASLHTWEGWAEALKDKRRVIRFDLPGFALTGPNPENDYSVESYVRFVTAMVDQLGVQKFVLGGNSLGGQIAWATAVALPQRVSSLILVDASGYPFESATTPVEVPLGFQIARFQIFKPLLLNTLPRGLVEKSVKAVYGDPSKVTPPLVDLYYDMTLRAGNRAALGRPHRRHAGCGARLPLPLRSGAGLRQPDLPGVSRCAGLRPAAPAPARSAAGGARLARTRRCRRRGAVPPLRAARHGGGVQLAAARR